MKTHVLLALAGLATGFITPAFTLNGAQGACGHLDDSFDHA